MEQLLNEAFASPILAQLWRSKLAKYTLEHLVKMNKIIDWNLVTDGDIQQMSGADAAKINSKEVWKFWSPNGNPSNIFMVTHSNAVFDRWFDVNRRTRVVKSIVNSSCLTADVLNGYATNGKKFLNAMKTCYIIDLDKLRANQSLVSTRTNRAEARKGATALMTDTEIKKQNLARYREILRRNKVTDGSEFGLITSITNLFGDAMKKESGFNVVMKLTYDSFFGNYLTSYSTSLLNCIQILNKVGFKIDAPMQGDDFQRNWDTDFRNYSDLAKNLKDGVERVKKVLNGKPVFDKLDVVCKMILNSDKKYEQFVSDMPDMNIKEKLISLGQMMRKINDDAKKAFQNAHITENLDNFDTFTMLIDNITRLNVSSKLFDVFSTINYAMNPDAGDKQDSILRSFNWKLTGEINTDLKKVDNMLIAISKI